MSTNTMAAIHRPFLHQIPHAINLFWLLKVRWAMFAGQILVLGGVHWGLRIELPLAKLSFLIGLGGLSNVVMSFWSRRIPRVEEWMLGVAMMLDISLLTGLLFFTGGPANPFSFLYLISIALGIVMLRTRWMWGLCLFAVLCYGSLFLRWDETQRHTVHNPHHMRMHLEGMWLAYAITTVFIGYFVTRMKRALTEREAELAAMYDLQIRSEKIASLAALAGGAVHEFSTPLATIAVVAKEIERVALKYPEIPEVQGVQEDAKLIRQEVERCKNISQELMTHAGETLGEASLSVKLETLFHSALEELASRERIQTFIDEQAHGCVIPLPPHASVQVLRGLLKNAEEASPPETPLTLRATIQDQSLAITVTDQGAGIKPEIAARLGEPFFTTKPASQGHGLGLFLAKTLMERLGGQLHIDSQIGRGTAVSLIFPLSVIYATSPPAN